MTIQLVSGKIHKARITQCLLHYEGSLEIDEDLLEAAGIVPYERILVVNITNGERLETYAIPGARGSKVFCLNGAAARRGNLHDQITIMAFRNYSPEEARDHRPSVIILNDQNEVVQKKGPAK